ncbi:tRNA 2-thiouridine(34) synthase MnmA [uncultured Bacteroides sp.]|uniref:tRNA 2-thiouridine(34) synthase MnmA n=1 Tax=uncultured Bacteroides sp. TaxID=162156 RepID=UPI002AABF529|nr:tRNA 2-thiouridine(34) synthase MnmA [uncultured Bacteroides sp.]
MKEQKRRVLVGMSGGIDSSATCLMLQEQGYEVVGLTMRVWDMPSKFTSPEQEFPDYILEAKELATRINIEHFVADERDPFREVVVKNFVNEYRQGRTPNPCVICNPLFKFRILTEWADRLGCEYIATGHYSLLEEREGVVYIVTGDDVRKDQSYFLWRLGQSVLKRCLFPLGCYTKPQVREHLLKKGFEAKAKEGESMEVCFIEGDYRDFLREQCPDLDMEIGKGWFVNAQGVKLGEHKGFPYYTIGQRKGLDIALGKPAYVLKLNPLKNTVMLGDADQLKAEYMMVEEYNITNAEDFFACKNLSVRIRYRSTPIPCRVKALPSGGLLVRFLQEASAVTPGQSAVFYDGRRLVGGGFIASQRGLGLVVEEHHSDFETN